MRKIWLWIEIGCNSDLSASVRSNQRINILILDSSGVVEESGSRVRPRVRVMCSKKSTGEIGLQLGFGSTSDVRVSTRISLRFKVQ